MNLDRKSNCIICKGSNPKKYCNRTFCPVFTKSQAMFKVQKGIEKDSYFGAAPSVFVGRHGWPNVNVGILTPPEEKENAWKYDAPSFWADNDYKIPEVIGYRGGLVNSRFKSSIWVNNNRELEKSQEISMASKPVDVEINLDKKPKFRMQFNSDILPMGPNAELSKVDITENPFIHRKVDKVVDDDLKSKDALNYLFNNEFDENFLSRLLSCGNLGEHKKRTLVPTRWSITAVDDQLGKGILNEIRDYKNTNYVTHFGNYLGNYFLVMFFPEIWSYELFELYLPKSSWNQTKEIDYVTDYEPFRGRKSYAKFTAGGYYASRLPVLEKLKGMKRQSSVVVIRVITDEYEVPLGVWVVREAIRKALNNKGLEFGSKELMLKYVRMLVNKKFGFDCDLLLNNSELLKNMKQQQKLIDFF